MALDKTTGNSSWRSDLNWLTEGAGGPHKSLIPSEFWLLGLGHLGQAYLWVIGLFKYAKPEEVNVTLQDFDKVENANQSAGLLCYKDDVGKYKSRVCND